MSRPRKPTQRCTDELPCIDLRALKREGLLVPGSVCRMVSRPSEARWLDVRIHATACHLRVEVSQFQQDQAVDPEVSTGRLLSSEVHWIERIWQDCSLGGQREVWRCVNANCQRVVCAVYVQNGRLGCRRCLNLKYASQRLGQLDRAEQRILKVQSKLGWQGGILSPNNGRPQGMWTSTYQRLTLEYAERLEGWVERAFAGIAPVFPSN